MKCRPLGWGEGVGAGMGRGVRGRGSCLKAEAALRSWLRQRAEVTTSLFCIKGSEGVERRRRRPSEAEQSGRQPVGPGPAQGGQTGG